MSAQKTKAAGHLAAIFTMLIWEVDLAVGCAQWSKKISLWKQ